MKSGFILFKSSLSFSSLKPVLSLLLMRWSSCPFPRAFTVSRSCTCLKIESVISTVFMSDVLFRGLETGGFCVWDVDGDGGLDGWAWVKEGEGGLCVLAGVEGAAGRGGAADVVIENPFPLLDLRSLDVGGLVTGSDTCGVRFSMPRVRVCSLSGLVIDAWISFMSLLSSRKNALL